FRLEHWEERPHIMRMAVIESTTAPDLRKEVHEAAERVRKRIQESFEDWFLICDHILDVHRSRYLFRQPSARELEDHKTAVSECIETCAAMAAQFTVRLPVDHDLLARLQARMRQLKDAYDTFHDPQFGDEDADEILKRVFPE